MKGLQLFAYSCGGSAGVIDVTGPASLLAHILCLWGTVTLLTVCRLRFGVKENCPRWGGFDITKESMRRKWFMVKSCKPAALYAAGKAVGSPDA